MTLREPGDAGSSPMPGNFASLVLTGGSLSPSPQCILEWVIKGGVVCITDYGNVHLKEPMGSFGLIRAGQSADPRLLPYVNRYIIDISEKQK